MEFKVGNTFYLKKDFNNEFYKCHIVGIIDENMIAYKWYGKRKQWWHYEIENKYYLQSQIKYTKEIMGE